jgi:hypothetical protein
VETAAMEAEAKMDSRAVEEGLAVMRQSTVKLMYAARLTWENIVVNLQLGWRPWSSRRGVSRRTPCNLSVANFYPLVPAMAPTVLMAQTPGASSSPYTRMTWTCLPPSVGMLVVGKEALAEPTANLVTEALEAKAEPGAHGSVPIDSLASDAIQVWRLTNGRQEDRWVTAIAYDGRMETKCITTDHRRPSGSPGRYGPSGYRPMTYLRGGVGGANGTCQIRVVRRDLTEGTYPSRYRIEVLSFDVVDENKDGINEPGEYLLVQNIRVRNSGMLFLR